MHIDKNINSKPLPLNLIGVILVGGKSSRMGVDKALLKLSAQENLLNRQINLFETLNCEKIIISTKQQYPVVAKYPQINDIDNLNIQGPVAGILSILLYLQANINASINLGKPTIIIFLPIDLPKITATTINKLISALSDKNDKNYQSAIYNNHNLPLAIIINSQVLKYVDNVMKNTAQNHKISKKSISVGDFLQGLSLCKILPTTVDEKALINTNTPEEWKEVSGEYPT